MMTLSAVSGTRRANTGGPASRTRREPVSSTLLDDGEGSGHCRRLITLGLTFPEGEDPVDWVEEALDRVGHADAESLRRSLLLPAGGLICAPAPDRTRLDVAGNPVDRILEQAVLLGLCNAHGYFPQRPVLWTRTTLTRSLYLYDPGGFYQ